MPVTPFPAELEPAYQEARFREYRQLSLAVGIAGVLLALGLWVRDYAEDPAGAAHTFALRMVMAAGVGVYVVSVWLRLRRALMLACGYFAILVIEFSVLRIWGRLGGGYAVGFPGYMYIYLVAPLMLLPFSFREAAALLVMVAIVPNLQAALGVAPGFPLLAFNALAWPACAITVFAQRQFDALFRRLFLSRRELAEAATQDPLTGLANRRRLIPRAEEAFELARRHGRPLSVLMIDVDHFKSVNDRFGHAAGDDVLRFLAATLELQLRGADLCGRLGGEEFAAVLPETGLEAAMATAERVRRAVERSAIATDHARAPIRVTLSIGVAAIGADGSLHSLLAAADVALYEAKAAGRNRVCAARGDEDGESGRSVLSSRAIALNPLSRT